MAKASSVHYPLSLHSGSIVTEIVFITSQAVLSPLVFPQRLVVLEI